MTNRAVNVQKIPLQPLSLMRMFWKHKILFLLTWLVIAAGGAAIVRSLPAVYQADTVILVESQKIPEKFVTPTVDIDLKDRLTSLSEQILSYSRLLEIIRKFDLYSDARQSHSQEEIVGIMRGDINIDVEKGWTKKADSRPGAFRISYQGPVPTVVAMVTNQLGSFFIDENVRAREMQAAGTSEFIETQLTEARRRLEEQEAKLSVYKLKFNGELPEQENALLANLSQLQLRLQGTQEGIERAQQNRMTQAAALASAAATESALTQFLEQASDPGRHVALGADPPERPSEQLQKRLNEALVIYKDDFPEIKALRDRIAQLRAEEEREAKAKQAKALEPKSPGQRVELPPPRTAEAFQLRQAIVRQREQVDALKAQQELTTQQIAVLEAERAATVAKIDRIQKSVGKLPVREQELASVKRDYEISRANYQSLLDKKLAAEMANDMERRQKSERFMIVDTAQVPEKPVKPNRMLLYAVSGIAGFMLGVALAVGRELRAGVVLGEWELPKGVPILGRVPRIQPSFATGGLPAFRVGGARISLRTAVICSALVLFLAALATAAGVYLGAIRF
jgi:polysaccharide biosynthesis transport protein